MDWLLPIVADILLNVLPTAKWACARQFSRQRLCFSWLSEHALSIFSLPDMFCCHLLTGSQMYPALHRYLAPWHLFWQFWLAYPRNGLQVLFVARASVSRSCSPAFSSTDLEQILLLMWRKTQNRSAGLSFLYLCFYSDVAPHALLSVVNCVRAFPQELRCCFPADIPRNWILWDAGSLGTVKAGVLLRGTLPLLHRHLERLVKKVITTLTSK